jgi:GNAT superfamily N-acetyltransferase
MAVGFTIRASTAADLSRIDALLARSYPRLLAADYPPSVIVTALPIIARARPDLVRSGTYFVAEMDGGAIIGAGGWTPVGSGTGPAAGEVRHVVTDDRHLRRGIGRAVMGAVLESASGAGLGLMLCLATRTAVPFYQALGFTALGPVEVPLAPGIGFPAIRMQRRM